MELTGTEKQISWANDIRSKKLDSLRTPISKQDVIEAVEFLKGERETFSRTGRFIDIPEVVSILMVEKDTQTIENFLNQQNAATFWIDNRNISARELYVQIDEDIQNRRNLRKELRQATKEEILQWFLG